MTICPRCGTQNPPESGRCGLCGAELPDATAPLGTNSPQHPGFGSTQALPPADFGRTMAGHGAPDVSSRAVAGEAPPPGQRPALLITEIGLAPLVTEGKRARTMLGLAPPLEQGSGAPGSTTLVMKRAAPTSEPPATEASAENQALTPPHTRTILGVARPGIAPVNPGREKPSFAAPTPDFPSPPPPPPLLSSPLPAQPQTLAPARRQRSFLGLLVIGAALAMLIAAGGLFLFMRAPARIEARPGLDASGAEQLELTCSDCEDGTLVRLGAVEATFKNHRAILRLASSLTVGVQTLKLHVQSPNASDGQEVSLSVRLEYRVRADLSTLAEATPRLRVVVDALPASVVLVANNPVILDAKGHGSVDIDVSRELTGPASSLLALERQVAYSVKPADGATQQGQVSFRLGIVPLLVEAPGSSITTEEATFVLAGRTQKGAVVGVSDRPLSVDAEGRFAQMMNVSKVGETTVWLRASAKDQAPRLFPIHVRRVASLRDEAAQVRARATSSYAAIATDTQLKRGWKVALEGSVLEARNQKYSTVLVLDTTSGCAKRPCLTKVIHGAPSAFLAGDMLSVFGSVSDAVDGPRGARVPEIVADFVLRAPR